MSTEVRVRRCSLTVRRSDGWSWGAGPQPHVEAALASVEAALEAAIAEAGVPDGVDVHLDAPVGLEVGAGGVVSAASREALVARIRASAAAAVAAGAGAGADGPDADGAAAPGEPRDSEPGRAASGDARDLEPGRAAGAGPSKAASSDDDPSPAAPGLGDGIHGATSEPSAAADAGATSAATPGDRGGASAPVAATEGSAAALARTLAAWSRSGHMARAIEHWPEELVRSWLAAIAAGARAAREAGEPPATMTADAVGLVADAVLGPLQGGAAASSAPSSAAHAGGSHRALVLLAALTAALGERLPDDHTRTLARTRAAGAGPVAHDATALDPALPAPTSPTRPRRDNRALPAEQVVAALPLLVLAQLARIGYLDALLAAAAAAGLPDGAGALAAALAGKVLPPPALGWHREPADAAAAASVYGGHPDDLPDALATIAANERALVAPLASALRAAYAEGRGHRDELLVWDGGEARGLPSTRAGLDETPGRDATAPRPTRAGGEGLMCGEAEGLLPAAWVGVQSELEAALAVLGRPPIRRGDGFAPLARALHARPGLPRLDAPALERELGAAAGTALGLLALNLWPGTGATSLVALDRLAGLEARVRREAGALRIGIPRGQRWLDLRRGGLLDDFDVAWLPGGRLEIVTW